VDVCANLAVSHLSSDKSSADTLLQGLQDRCMQSSTKLMKDLLSLEGILASTPEAREKKRAQTMAINDLLQTVEHLGYKLHSLRQVLQQAEAQPTPSSSPTATPTAENSTPTRATEPERRVTQETAPQRSQKPMAARTPVSPPPPSRPTREDVAKYYSKPTGGPLASRNAAAEQIAAEKADRTTAPPAVPTRGVEAPASKRPQAAAAQSGGDVGQLQQVERWRQLARKTKQVTELVLSEEKWRQLKFEPKFESEQQLDAFYIKTYVPGLRKEDISVSLTPLSGGNSGEDGFHQVLVISGVRIPPKQELHWLATTLAEKVERGDEDSQKFLSLSNEQLLLSLGAGRYGTFVQKYALPSSAEVSTRDITARYDDSGLLVVRVPKLQQQRPSFYPPTREAAGGYPFVTSPYVGGQPRPASGFRPNQQVRAGSPVRSIEDLFW